jgi:hypothetical protein
MHFGDRSTHCNESSVINDNYRAIIALPDGSLNENHGGRTHGFADRPLGGVDLEQFLDDDLANDYAPTPMAARGVRPTSVREQHRVQTWPDKSWNVISRRSGPLD